MKTKFVILLGMALTALLAGLAISCSGDDGQYDVEQDYTTPEITFMEYANTHNLGLDYIKSEIQKANGFCSKELMESAFEKFMTIRYGETDAVKLCKKIEPVKDLIFNLDLKNVSMSRGNDIDIANQINPVALEAFNKCAKNISNYLAGSSKESLFDNDALLDDLQSIIIETYRAYAQISNSNADTQAVAQVLGVLYGSVEYWTNSENVRFWTNVDAEEFCNYSVNPDLLVPQARAENKTEVEDEDEDKKEDRELSPSDYIVTVASADAIGGLFSGIGAILTSGAAALYFDVK